MTDVKNLGPEENVLRRRYLAWTKKHSEQYPNNYDQEHKLGIYAILPILESLAVERELSETRRALLEKHQWAGHHPKAEHKFCLECHEQIVDGHAPDCAIATALQGLPRKENVRAKD